MVGRKWNLAGGYRYGFNGKENDNEVKGEGNQQDYGMRVYDPRIGKFLSVDPLTKSYPELTPYQFASNRPIDGIDLDGKEWRPIVNWLADKAKASGRPRLSGFIRSFGASDVHSDVNDFVNNVGKGDIGAAAAQLYGYTSVGMAHGILTTTQSAVKGDKEAQGQLLGIGLQTVIGHAAGKIGRSAKTGVEPVKEGSKTAKSATATTEDKWANFDFDEYKTVYHKGNLVEGKVSLDRPLSTGTDPASVDAIRGGNLYEFKIPSSKFNEWRSKDLIKTFKDYDNATGVYNEEIRFDKSLGEELNKYIVKDKK